MAEAQEGIMQTVAVVGLIMRWALEQAVATAAKNAYNNGKGRDFYRAIRDQVTQNETDHELVSICLASIDSPPEKVEKVLDDIWSKMSDHCVKLFKDAQQADQRKVDEEE